MDEERRARQLDRIARLRPIDDALMRKIFQGQDELVAETLSTLTGIAGLAVERSETQYDLRHIGGSRSAVLDVVARGIDGTAYDMEVQRGDAMRPKRARYYAALMDVDGLPAGEDFEALPERWVIFVMEDDPLGRGRPTYGYEHRDSAGGLLGDGGHVLYANGAWDGDDALGRLMRDFHRADPDEMETPALRERVKYLKGTEKGRQEMSDITQEIFDEGVEQGIERGIENARISDLKSLMETLQIDAAKAMELLKVPMTDRAALTAIL